jgi:hypothetical protein
MMENLERCLQLFAEGADGDTAQFTGETEAAAAPPATGEETASDAGMQELEQEFSELIKGKYKACYDARLQDTLKKRLRGQKELAQRMEALNPLVEKLAGQYGVAPGDIPGLQRAMEEATARTPEWAALQARDWAEQAHRLKGRYPRFDLGQALADPRFARLLQGGATMEAAYEVLNKDRLLPQAMHITAKLVEQKLANKLLADAARPAENGTTGASAAVVRQDVSQMSRLDRAEIIRRVQKGEKISF